MATEEENKKEMTDWEVDDRAGCHATSFTEGFMPANQKEEKPKGGS